MSLYVRAGAIRKASKMIKFTFDLICIEILPMASRHFILKIYTDVASTVSMKCFKRILNCYCHVHLHLVSATIFDAQDVCTPKIYL